MAEEESLPLLILGDADCEARPVQILGAITNTNTNSTSLLNLPYPVPAVVALGVWNFVSFK